MEKKLVITEPMEIEIPKAGMVVRFDGTTVQIGFITNTELVVNGDLKIATTGDFEVVTAGDAIISTLENGKVRLGYAEEILKDKNKEIE